MPIDYQMEQRRFYVKITLWITFAVVAVIILMLGGCPVYGVWQQGLAGKAELKRAEMNRKIAIQEAEAKLESAKFLAKAEIERAKGVAGANKIIGDSLKNNEAYLRWLWIENVGEKTKKTVIYVPTETQLPILEATRHLLKESWYEQLRDAKKKGE